MYIERFIHDADKSKLHDFLLSEKLTENLVYGYAEQDIVYRRIESEKSHIKMRAKKYVDIKAHTCLDLCKNATYMKAPFVKIDGEIISEATVEKVLKAIESKLNG